MTPIRLTLIAALAATTGLLALPGTARAQDQGGDPLAAARAQLEQGRPGEAVALLQGLLGGEGGAADERAVRLLLSQAQIAAGDAQQAVETIAPLAEKGDPEVLLATGRAYKAWGDEMQRQGAKGDDVGFAYDEARSYLEQAAKKAARGQSAAAIELGNLELYTLGDHAAALARAETLVEGDPKDAEARLFRGCALVWASIDADGGGDQGEAGKLRTKAIDDLLAAAKALPQTRPEPWAQLAWLYEADGQQAKAVEAAVKALERAPNGGVGTLYHLALRYANERRYDVASVALTSMVKTDAHAVTRAIAAEADPNAAALALTYAVTPLLEGQPVAARDALAAIVAAHPKIVDPWNNYALLCRETKQYEEAYDAYVQALLLEPDNPRLNNDAGVILHYYLHRDYDKAQEYYTKAVEMADEALAAPDLDPTAREELQTAKADAVGNLKKLAKGDHNWP